MDVLELLIQYIIDQGLAKEQDEDIFKDYEPSEPDDCIIINEYAGSAIDQYSNMNVRSVQVVVRNNAGQNARILSWQLLKLLKPVDKIIELGTKKCIIENRNTPVKYKVDNLNRKYYAFNIGITINYN